MRCRRPGFPFHLGGLPLILAIVILAGCFPEPRNRSDRGPATGGEVGVEDRDVEIPDGYDPDSFGFDRDAVDGGMEMDLGLVQDDVERGLEDTDESSECNRCTQTQVCVEDLCEELPPCPCPQDSYCDPQIQRCIAGCLNDEACGAGRICDPSVAQCRDGCRQDIECASGQICVENACVDGCRQDGDCPDNHGCEANQCIDQSYRDVSTGVAISCALDYRRQTRCWGSTGLSSPPTDFFDALSVWFDLGCGIRTNDESIACWGPMASARTPPSGAYLSLSVRDRMSCAVRTDNGGVCWGES
ncbi:MAG: hypothetical protein ACNA8W_03400, partial [Bradymonadaceae bacterium]